MRPTSLAMVITSMAGGGAEKLVLLLARTIRTLGHRCAVFVLRPITDYEQAAEDEDLHLVPGHDAPKRHRAIVQARALERLVAREAADQGRPFDLVMSHLIEAAVVVARCRFTRVVDVVHASIDGHLAVMRRTGGPFKYLRDRRRFGMLSGRHLVAVSRSLASELESSRVVRPASVRVIRNPIDVGRVRELAGLAEDGVPTGRYILHVGRAARQKRHDVLLKAFRRLPDDVRLVCLAENTDKLARIVRRHRLTDRVVMPGFRQNPYAWMRGAAAVALASDFEGFPLVILEALAVGTPVVATDCPTGPREILGDVCPDCLVPMRDPEALGEAMLRVLERPPPVRLPFGDELEPVNVARRYLDLAQPAATPPTRPAA